MSDTIEKLIQRKLRSIEESIASGTQAFSREHRDDQNYRTAANQFRQAAKELDKLDGILTAQYYFGRSK